MSWRRLLKDEEAEEEEEDDDDDDDVEDGVEDINGMAREEKY